MSINKVEQSLELKVPKTIAQIERDVRDLKTPQPLGADVLKVAAIPSGGFLEGGPITITAGNYSTFIITLTPSESTLTLWNFAHSIYVDTDADAGLWPQAGLTTAQRRLIDINWLDWATSSDVSNTRVYYVRIKNDDSSDHNYYIKVRAYLPSLTGTTI